MAATSSIFMTAMAMASVANTAMDGIPLVNPMEIY
jgi:hypothetical protein